MKSIIPLAVACASTFSLMTAAPAEAGGYYRSYYGPRYSRVQYVHRPYYYSYHRPYYYSYRRPYYYPPTYVSYRPAYYYDDAYYPSYYAVPSFGLSFAFGGSHWGGSHGGHHHYHH